MRELERAVLRAAARGGAAVVPAGSHRITRSVALPPGLRLELPRGASLELAEGVELGIDGVELVAGRWPIFAGRGRTRGVPRNTEAFPEWFGAAGQGDDTVAFQRTVELGRPVVGDGRTRYRINTERVRWTALDLHRAGKPPEHAGEIIYPAGYWYGVRLLSGSRIERCRFALLSTHPERAGHAFASGDPRSAARHAGAAIVDCEFELATEGGRPQKRPRCVLAQSSDGFRFTRNRVGRPRAAGRQTRLTGAWFFDCRDPAVEENSWNGLFITAGFQFSTGIVYDRNVLTDCSIAVDCDKRCVGFSARGNRYDRERPDRQGDAMFELNGTRGVRLSENACRHARRYLLLTGKPDVYDSWAMVMRQAGTASFNLWADVVSTGNVVERTSGPAVLVGTDWRQNPHPATPAGAGLALADRYLDCVTEPGRGRDLGAVVVHEGRDVRLESEIRGSRAAGVVARSFVDAQARGATQASDLEIVAFGGSIQGCAGEGFRIERPRRVVFTGLFLQRNGSSAGAQAVIEQPEARGAVIGGPLEIVGGTADTARRGLVITSGDFVRGGWRADLGSARLQGHAEDLVLLRPDGAAGRPDLLRLNGARIGRTNVDGAAADLLRGGAIGAAAPLAPEGRPGYHPAGEIRWKSPSPRDGGWICVRGGDPGVWLAFTQLQDVLASNPSAAPVTDFLSG